MTEITVANIKAMKGALKIDDVYIGRANRTYSLAASKWANPFKIGPDGTRHEVLDKYVDYILSRPDLMDALHELRGKRLVCWCAPLACHGDVLKEMVEANDD